MTLLVAHGLGRTADEWLSCARAIAREPSIGPDAIVPDLAELRVVDRKPDTAAVIATLLAALDPHPDAFWLGHSGGAHVMIEAALLHPTRVKKLVLVAVVPPRALVERLACPWHVIAMATHDPHLDDPAELVARARAFYASV